jgi:hypothetical protein
MAPTLAEIIKLCDVKALIRHRDLVIKAMSIIASKVDPPHDREAVRARLRNYGFPEYVIERSIAEIMGRIARVGES